MGKWLRAYGYYLRSTTQFRLGHLIQRIMRIQTPIHTYNATNIERATHPDVYTNTTSLLTRKRSLDIAGIKFDKTPSTTYLPLTTYLGNM